MISIPNLFRINNIKSNDTIHNNTFTYFIILPSELQVYILTIYPNQYIVQLNKELSQNINIIETFNNYCLYKNITANEINHYNNDNFFGYLINFQDNYHCYLIARIANAQFTLHHDDGDCYNYIDTYHDIQELISYFWSSNVYLVAYVDLLKFCLNRRTSAISHDKQYIVKYITHYLKQLIKTFYICPRLVEQYIPLNSCNKNFYNNFRLLCPTMMTICNDNNLQKMICKSFQENILANI